MTARAPAFDRDVQDFLPGILALQERPPSPLPRATLHGLLLLVAALLTWTYYGKVDIVAVAEGKLVPKTYLKIVQPADGGILKEILVNEGDHVTAGQVLIRMDTQLSEADTRILDAEIAQRALQLRRIDAELRMTSDLGTGDGTANTNRYPGWDSGIQWPEPAPELIRGKAILYPVTGHISSDLIEQVRAQYEAHRRAYEDARAEEQAGMAKAQQDLAAAEQVRKKLQALLPTYQQEEAALEKLGKSQLAAQLDVIERRRKRIETEQDLRAQERTVQGLKALITQSEKKLAQITSSYREQLHNERIEAQAQLGKLQQEHRKQQHRNTLLELKAPQDGIVKDLATHTLGAVVSPGAVLLTLVPNNEALQAEVIVKNQDIGFVRKNQRAKVKFVAFPFQKYGLVDGTVTHVSADATEASRGQTSDHAGDSDNAVASNSNGLGYKVIVQLKTRHLTRGDRTLDLTPGMQVTAEIHQGQRTILEYLLSPVQRVAHDAFRER